MFYRRAGIRHTDYRHERQLWPLPFDRLLIAQARSLGVPIVTGDEAISAYPVETVMV